MRGTGHTNSNLPDFITLKNIWGLGQILKLLQYTPHTFLQPPVTLSLLGSDILLNTLFLNTLNQRSVIKLNDKVLHPLTQHVNV
jgi:hypothetical protein